MRAKVGGCVVALALFGGVGTAVAHEFLDHPSESFVPDEGPPSSNLNAGGEDAEWELVETIPTGNPHTDLDFFTQGGITYASVGTLAAGANAAGQTIVQLTNAAGDVVTKDGEPVPEIGYLSGHPSATCPGIATGVTGLQHDAEAAPKGNALVQFPNPYVDTRPTQIVLDATDAPGRCHDQGDLGIGAPQGGLEIIDVTDPAKPTEIGLTAHVGQAHTVNVDPKRPHIAFVSSSDFVNYNAEGVRANDEHPAPPPPPAPPGVNNSMDGIEVVDMSTCMNFPAGATRQFKIENCRPKVYRYRWPNAAFASSSLFHASAACHELEIYPDDRVVCAAVDATLLLDFSKAFDDNGTPTDYSDDHPRGTPLPCAVRATKTNAQAPWKTSAMVTDCVIGEGGQSLRVPDWRKLNPPPSLEGVEKLGAAHHMGFENQQRDNAGAPYDATEDIWVSHEAELTQSGRYVLATDERGGGVLPIGASCSPGGDNSRGNGGIHAFPVDKLGTTPPEPSDPADPANPPGPPGEQTDEVDAYQEKVYAQTSEGERAIFRTPIETKPQGSLCTSHVFQQIPGQNRIFMAWYSQGTQVVDFTENADGTIDFERAGFFVPENANEWTSHIFKVQENTDGSFTYWGAAGDFALGDAGRNAIDIYQTTLPAPPKPRTESGEPIPGTPTFPTGQRPPSPSAGPGCASASAYTSLRSKPRNKRKRVRFSFDTVGDSTVDATVFRRSRGRSVVRRRVKTFTDRESSFTWGGRRTRRGFYDVRFVSEAPNGSKDVRHLSVRRRNGRFYNVPPFSRRESCALVKWSSLARSVFGGRRRVPLKVKFTLAESATVEIELTRRGKVVKTLKAKSYPAGKSSRKIRLSRKKSRRGQYRVTLNAERPGSVNELALFSRHL